MCAFKFQNCFRPTPLMSTILLLCEMGVSGWLRVTMEHSGVTYRVSDSYKANSRTFFVSTFGSVVFDLARFFSYAEMFFEFNGATSKRKSGMPRLSRRPSHWGYYEAVSTHIERAAT
jgi:hypothetical protein